jgi:hypothetical protein
MKIKWYNSGRNLSKTAQEKAFEIGGKNNGTQKTGQI